MSETQVRQIVKVILMVLAMILPAAGVHVAHTVRQAEDIIVEIGDEISQEEGISNDS